MAAATNRGARGFPKTAQGNRVSVAQSGGVSRSFQGGSGGNAYGRNSTQEPMRGTITSYRGLKVGVRPEGGDTALVRGSKRKKTPLSSAGKVNKPGERTNVSRKNAKVRKTKSRGGTG